MGIFSEYVNNVLRENTLLANLRTTVEKELFHQDILRIIASKKIISDLTFMGGTCLRLCYESERLSEDLDFCTEAEISEEKALLLADSIKTGLSEKYNLEVDVGIPQKDTDTQTWKIKIVTNPGNSSIPSQKIHIDICRYRSYLNEIRLVRNPYSGTGYSTLFIKAEKQEEILIDKLIAFAMRNRIKNRDLWDIYSLYCKNIKLDVTTLKNKLYDRKISFSDFVEKYKKRTEETAFSFPSDFKDELSRFLKSGMFEESILSEKEGPSAFNTILSDYLEKITGQADIS